MRALAIALPLLLVCGCLDFHTDDPCGRFSDRTPPASCLTGDGGGGGACPAFVAPSGDGGDLLQPCTALPDGGSPDCAAGEACMNLVGPTVCVRLCGTDPTVCTGGTICHGRDTSGRSMPTMCLPTCNPLQPGLGCPQAWACAPTSPNFDYPGVCLPNCNSFGCSGPSQCDTTSGVCGCTSSSCPFDPFDSSASVPLQCDPDSRVCYRPCTSGCGGSCCDSTSNVNFCRVQPGAAQICERCTNDTDCASLFCDPSTGRCNNSSDDCAGTGECEHVGLTCVANNCVCPRG